MPLKKVDTDIRNNVGMITINNPPVNTLDQDLKDEFLDRLGEMAASDGVRVLIISGAGEKNFAAGANIPGLLDLDAESGLRHVLKSREFYSRISSFEKPIIAALNGFCLGGGLELALCCDVRVAAEHVKMGLPEVGLGIIPGAGGTQRLPRAIGPGWANYLFFTGEAIPAGKALEIGLVQVVVPGEQLTGTAFNIAKKIAGKSPLAVQAAKKAAAMGITEPLEKGLDIENQFFSNICATSDKNEGISAFLEKRTPCFKGQ